MPSVGTTNGAGLQEISGTRPMQVRRSSDFPRVHLVIFRFVAIYLSLHLTLKKALDLPRPHLP